jgi:hypothetical protein
VSGMLPMAVGARSLLCGWIYVFILTPSNALVLACFIYRVLCYIWWPQLGTIAPNGIGFLPEDEDIAIYETSFHIQIRTMGNDQKTDHSRAEDLHCEIRGLTDGED